MARIIIVRVLVIISLAFGVHRVCCLGVLDSVEDFFKYRKMSVEDFRMKLNNQDPRIIDEIRSRVRPGEGVLVLDREQYFIGYYSYPVMLYKFNKGYYRTSKRSDFKDVGQDWLRARNVKWVFLADEDGKMSLKNIDEMKR